MIKLYIVDLGEIIMSINEDELGDNLEQAKKLWENANEMLEKANVTGYLTAIENLHRFMKENKLKEEELRAELSDKEISPKGFAVLQQIWKAATDYSRTTATINESTQECGFVSAISKTSAFFMDCKLNPNERAVTDPDVHLDNHKILISIMQHIKAVATFDSKIGDCSTRALMTHKISEILKLERSNNVNSESLEQVLSSKGENLSQDLSYKYATFNVERKHRYTADTFNGLKAKYQEARGDALKTEILADFKAKLEEATDKQGLDQIVKELKKSDEYKILKTGQDVTTRLLGLKTSSVAAFEDMIKNMEVDISTRQSVAKSM